MRQYYGWYHFFLYSYCAAFLGHFLSMFCSFLSTFELFPAFSSFLRSYRFYFCVSLVRSLINCKILLPIGLFIARWGIQYELHYAALVIQATHVLVLQSTTFTGGVFSWSPTGGAACKQIASFVRLIRVEQTSRWSAKQRYK